MYSFNGQVFAQEKQVVCDILYYSRLRNASVKSDFFCILLIFGDLNLNFKSFCMLLPVKLVKQQRITVQKQQTAKRISLTGINVRSAEILLSSKTARADDHSLRKEGIFMRKTGMRRKAAGFYLAVAVSAAALGVAAWLASVELETEEVQPAPQLTASVPSSEATEEVLIPKRDVPREETPSSIR